MRLASLLALLVLASTAAADGLPYLATLTIERASDQSGRLADSIRVEAHVTDTDAARVALEEVDGVTVTGAGDGIVSIIVDRRPTFSAAPDSSHLAATFVVDYDETAVRELLPAINDRFGENPTIAELKQFVYEHIDDKTYARAFDLPSRVAATRQGDCTEHAILLVALARAYDMPARMVSGSMIIETAATDLAFGHAWAEVHTGGRWQIFDATLPDADDMVIGLHYLPISTLVDEGPGYSWAMAGKLLIMPRGFSGLTSVD